MEVKDVRRDQELIFHEVKQKQCLRTFRREFRDDKR